MFKNVKGNRINNGIDYSKVYSKNEVAQLFSCISPGVQDELIAVMRQMVANNETKQERLKA